ncbi:hypothetical protein DFH07DRAFT_1062389 [Mycena maculata]|uniref:Uncharacterized protein n=1 Tax=Mycena maculata TaxID=230809 RepID=A0AAD7ISF2_9AGAR|nr:hypothetical protein DFH07DRAFT_1062389 [Mycena maculata]
MSSKRHSLPVGGPRPLQLANGPVSDGLPSAPLSAASSFSPSPLSPLSPTTPNGGSRRPSSITYNPSTRTARSAGHRSTLGRSNSVGGSLDRRHTVVERSPVTLAEKARTPFALRTTLIHFCRHADLLHFIAQKESKCLELRSQLAVHEAELLQLKRKWERIVSRGFTSPHNTSLASTSSGATSGSSMEQSPNPTSANGGAMLDGIREGVQGVGRFIAAFSPTPYSSFESSMHGTHSPSSSMSTMATSTSASKSTRLSQSSASSLGEETCPPTAERATDDADGAQVLMVHDTGATPTMSPNPAFTARRQQRAKQRESESSADAEDDFFFAGAQAAQSTPPPTARPGAAKRAASTGALPGLALGVVESVAPVSSWVGTAVGKKWEELQRAPTFAKNSKRASLLFSDIAHALQVGPPPSSSPSPVPSTSSHSLLDDDDSGAPMMPHAPALTPAPAPHASLPLSARATRQQQPQSPLTLSKSKVPPPPQAKPASAQDDDDDDEWNW